MRLRRLDLTRYGKFTDYSIDFGAHTPGTPDLHIVYGLNEAGKSTSLSAYLDLLFGIEERTRYGFLHQGKAMEVGGCLEFGGETHVLKRLKQRANSLLNEHGQPVNEAVLGVPLAGLTRDAYRMMFSLDDQTLEDGGNAIMESKGDLGELLFSASAGLAGISSILEVALEEADRIYRKRASSTRIAVLKRQIAELKSRRDDIDTQASAYAGLVAALRQAEASYDEVMREKGIVRARDEEIVRILRAHPLAADYHRGEELLRDYAGLPHPPQDWTRTFPDLVTDETRLQTRLAGLDRQQAQLSAELDSLDVDEALLDLADRLERLPEAAARYSTAEEDLPKRKAALEQRSRQVAIIAATLGQQDVADPKTLLVPAATIGALRDLIAERSGLDVARKAAETEYRAALEGLEDGRRDRLSLDQGNGALDQAMIARFQSLVTRIRQSDLASDLRHAERALPERRKQVSDATGMLEAWTGDTDSLRTLALPDPGRLEAWRAVLNDLFKRRTDQRERRREQATREQEDMARLAALRDAAGAIGDEEASAAFAQRREAWERHMASLDRGSAQVFEDKLRATDSIADTRLSHAKELTELRALTTGLAVTSAAIARHDELLAEIEDELAVLRAEIRAEVAPDIELSPDATVASWLALIDRWVKNRSAAVSAWDALAEVEQAISQARSAIEAEEQALADLLGKTGFDASGLALPALLQVAEDLLVTQKTLATRRSDIDKRVGELERALAARTRARDEAEAALAGWQARFDTALASTWFADRAGSLGAVAELLDALLDLPSALRDQDDIQHRIVSMEADRAAFSALISGLYKELGETFDGVDPLGAAKALSRRFEDAKGMASQRQGREAALADLAREREAIEQDIAIHDARKAEMTSLFNVETLADVRVALERCGDRALLVDQQAKLERQLIAEMQQASLRQALDSLADTDLAELQREQAELKARLDDIDERGKLLFADKARATDRLNAIGGDDAVARIEAERRTVLLEIEDLAMQFLRLRTGSLVAEHALRAYRDKHRSAMMNRASQAFQLMTRDEYSGLATRPDKEREALIGLSRQGGSKLAVDMSKGTRFQLYLALRLAGYEEFAAARPSVPFIADDIMETFDEPRSEEVFRLFGQMAGVGQVIYLTHHRHLCDLARQTVPGVKIHEI